MASQFFLYRYKFNPFNGKHAYWPSHDFELKYTECKYVAKMTCEIVPVHKYRTLTEDEISGLRVGKLEWDTAGMAALDFTDAQVVEELVNFGRDFAVKSVTKEELAVFIRKYCDLTEREPGLFVISEASTEAGIERPEVTLDLR